MTAGTSQKLADALRAAGFEALAVRAETDEFHDFLSPHDFPEMTLDNELVKLIKASTDERQRIAALHIRMRMHDGEFDADLKESDDWAESEEGQAAFRMLREGK